MLIEPDICPARSVGCEPELPNSERFASKNPSRRQDLGLTSVLDESSRISLLISSEADVRIRHTFCRQLNGVIDAFLNSESPPRFYTH